MQRNKYAWVDGEETSVSNVVCSCAVVVDSIFNFVSGPRFRPKGRIKKLPSVVGRTDFITLNSSAKFPLVMHMCEGKAFFLRLINVITRPPSSPTHARTQTHCKAWKVYIKAPPLTVYANHPFRNVFFSLFIIFSCLFALVLSPWKRARNYIAKRYGRILINKCTLMDWSRGWSGRLCTKWCKSWSDCIQREM